MNANEVVKRNLSGLQVIKTLQLLMEDNYTMIELTEKLNEREKTPNFNHSVVSKYINTCRYLGFDIPKIHNKYFVAKVPFGLNMSGRDVELIENLSQTSSNRLTNKQNKIFDSFFNKLNKYSNKDITRVENKTVDLTYELFNKAIQQKRRVMLMFRIKALMECIPVEISERKGKPAFKVIHNNKVKYIAVDRISGLEVLGKRFTPEEHHGQTVIFKLTGELAQRYSLREHEEEIAQSLPDYITISNHGENKEELLSRLLRYDKNCEIISPKSYRDDIKTMLDSMLANYGE